MLAAAYNPTKTRRVSLRTTVQSVISTAPDRSAVTHLVEASHRLALAYLIKKRQSSRLQASLFGVDLEDLALDSIADLFHRERGQFVVLQTYFEGQSSLETEEEVAVALRRLVFSKVNENLFRRYHEVDGNLSRVIRNVKDGIKVLPRARMIHRGGQPWIVVVPADAKDRKGAKKVASDPRLQKALPPSEALESYFTSCLCHVRQVRDLTAMYADFVDAHQQYSSGYPLVPFAEIIRSAFLRTEEAAYSEEDDQPVFAREEIEEAIAHVTKEVMAEKRASYVGRGKVDEKTYEAYFETVSFALTSQYVRDLDSASFYSLLSRCMPGLTEDEYMENHRNILEYIVKLVRGKLIDYLKDRAA